MTLLKYPCQSVIKAAFGDGQQLRQAPYRIYRALVPIEKLVDHKRDMELKEQAKDSFAMFFSSDKQVSWFEGRDGLLQDLEAGYIVSEGDDPKAETDPEKAYAKMMQRFADIHPDLLNVLAKAENVTDWEVNFSRPLPRLWKGKAVLIGDAAHSVSVVVDYAYLVLTVIFRCILLQAKEAANLWKMSDV